MAASEGERARLDRRTYVRIEQTFPWSPASSSQDSSSGRRCGPGRGCCSTSAALAPEPGTEQLVGAVTTAAEKAGVTPGMRLGEALATCPGLVLVERDPAAVEQEWEGLLLRLEDAGFAVEPLEPGVVVFETTGVERLYGGVEAALRKALASVGPAWDPRAGAGLRRFVALAAASVARAGQAVIVEGKEEQAFLEPLPLTLLPLRAGALRRAGGARRPAAGRARPAAGWRRRGAAGAGGEAGVEPRPRRGAPPRAWAISRGRAGRGALLPRGGRERADAATSASPRCSTGW